MKLLIEYSLKRLVSFFIGTSVNYTLATSRKHASEILVKNINTSVFNKIFFTFYAPGFYGSIYRDGFKLYYQSYWRNSFAPIFRGQIIEIKNNHSKLVGRIGLPRLTIIFTPIWLFGVTSAFLSEPITAIIVLLIGSGIACLGINLSANEKKKILTHLESMFADHIIDSGNRNEIE